MLMPILLNRRWFKTQIKLAIGEYQLSQTPTITALIPSTTHRTFKYLANSINNRQTVLNFNSNRCNK
jgi:hypothetical protein